MNTGHSVVGKNVRKVDGVKLVTGKPAFTDDVQLPGLLDEVPTVCLESLEVGVPRRRLHAAPLPAAELLKLGLLCRREILEEKHSSSR